MSKLSRSMFKVLDVIVIFMMIFGSPTSALAQVWTDPTDYPPGSTVTLHGDNSDADAEHNWLPGEHIVVEVVGPNGYTAQCEADADTQGVWACDIVLWDSPDAVGEYVYTATGAVSGNVESGVFTDAPGDINKVYQHWSDTDVTWQNDILSATKSDYFEGEVIPHVYVYKASNNTPLTNGQSYTFNVTYNYYQQNTNAGGFAYMTTYNISRDPGPLNATDPYIPPTEDASFTNGGGMQGDFYTVDADITAVSAVTYAGSGSKDGVVTITFTYTGTTTTNGIAEIYFGLYVAKPGEVPDQGNGTTLGASAWSGGSLQTDVGGTSLQLSPAGIIAGQISGMKFNDLNSSGAYDAGEPGLLDWTIELCSDSGCTSVLQTAKTAADGSYSFSVLPGTYYVREVNQLGWTQTAPSTDYYGPLVVTATTPQYLNQDFGNGQYALSLTKADDLNPDKYDTVGQLVTYTITATNDGATALHNVTVSDDPALDSFSCTPAIPVASLAPGDSVVCTGTHSITQADLNAGSFADTASASSTEAAAPDATDTIYGSANPLLSITKKATETSFSSVGDVIHYTIEATNDGNVTLAAVTVTDTQVSDLTCAPANGSSLVPLETLECTASHTVTQADLDAGSFYNQACVDDGTDGAKQACADVTTPGLGDAQLTIDKTATPSTYSKVGDIISYGYLVTNTGNLTLFNISVVDDKATVTCPDTSAGLAPLGTVTCSASYSITQGDLDSGSVTNTAYAQSGSIQSTPDSETVTANKLPALTIVKTATPKTYSKVGDVISYSYLVTNSGNVTLFNISVVDDKATVTCPDTSTGLAPLGTITCTASYTIAQADLDAGSVTNTAYATDGTTESQPDSETVTAIQSPALSLVKTATPGTYDEVGDVISYSYVVKNTGNVTLAGPVSVSDDKATVTCPPGSLVPAASITCTASYTITQADLDSGSVTNTAQAHANGTDSNTDSETVTAIQSPGLSLVKTATPGTYDGVGDVISYSYALKNIGNVTLVAPFSVSDDKAAATCPATPTSLAPGESLTCTASYSITQVDLDSGSVTNTAQGHATFGTTAVDSNYDYETVYANKMPALTIVKTATPKTYSNVGDVISYSYLVTNSGNVTLFNISVVDDKAAVTCPDTSAGLAPLGTITCSATYTITQADLDNGSVTNTAYAKAGDTQSPPDSETVTADKRPALDLVKTATPNFSDPVKVGDTISYTLVATNTGNVTLFNVSISDAKLGALTCTPTQPATLAPAAMLSCSGSYALTQADIDAGHVANTAFATSMLPGGGTGPGDQDSQDVPVPQNPHLSVSKSVTEPSFDAAGETLHYTIIATNDGNVTLAAVTVTDPSVSGLACTPANGSTLAPGASMTCTATHTVTQADLDAGHYANTACVDDGAGGAAQVCASKDVPATQTPHLAITKAATETTYSKVGDVIHYTIVAENDGNLTLHAVTVTDPSVSNLVCTPTSPVANLAPGAKINCTADHTVTQADLDAGHYANTACVDDGTDGADQACASEDVDAAQNPHLSITKAAAPMSYDAVGQIITYTIVATNDGNVTLSTVTVTDPGVSGLSCTPANGSPLAPGASLNCTGTHTITQADLDAGHYANTACVDDGANGATQACASKDVPAVKNPHLKINKTATETAYSQVGDVIHYTIVATNDGNVTLAAVTVTDAAVTGLTCIPANGSALAPGASMTCTATHTVTQADLDAGHYANTACVDDGANGAAQVCAGKDVLATQNPHLAITKAATETTYSKVGDVIHYTIVATNDGNVTLHNVNISDSNVSGLTCVPAIPVSNLAPGSSINCSATHTVTQADLDAGHYYNQACVNDGTGPAAQACGDKDVPGTQNPSIDIVKTTNGGDGLYIPFDAPITWSYLVTNTGNVTLSNITVTDSKLVTVTCPKTTLAPSQFMTCTATGTAVAGAYANTGTASGKPPVGDNVTDSDDSSYFGSLPSIDIVKTTNGGDGLYIPFGSAVTWSFKVTNTGNVTLTAVAVTDNKLGAITCPKTTLAAGEEMTCTATGTAIAGAYSNTGSVSGKPPVGSNVTDSDGSSYFGSKPFIHITKTTNGSDGLYIEFGGAVTWRYVFANQGNVTLTNVTVTDSDLGAVCTIASMAPGTTSICTKTGTAVAGLYENTGTVTGTPPVGSDVTDSDDSSYFGSRPLIEIAKTTNGGDGLSILKGNSITWTFTVKNTGNVTLTNVTVTDNKLAATTIKCNGGTTNVIASLAPAEVAACKASGTAGTGLYENIGSVTGKPPVGSNVTNTDPSSYFGADPQISIVKVTNGSDGPTIIAGTTVTWTYTVTNVGNVPLSDVTVTDNKAGVTPVYKSGDTNADGLLDLTETWIYEATGTAIVEAYSNIGTASGSYTDDEAHSRTDSATDTSSYTGKAQVKVSKTVNGKPFSGPELTFELRQGAAPVTGQFGTVLESQKANVTNNGQITFTTLLGVGTYQLCEYVPEGYVPSYIWGTYGVDWFKPGYAPGQGGLDPNILVCVNFTVKADGTIDFQNGKQIVPALGTINIDNQVGQMPRTIGYWKNHASASQSNGGQAPVLDQMLYTATQAGQTIQIGTVLLPGGATPDNAGTSAIYAVRLLNKSNITTNKKMASDPCFNLAAQLLGYRLNAVSGAWPNVVAATAADYAQAMLLEEGFNGMTHVKLSAKAIANLNYLAKVLDAYNNDTLAITTLSLPYPEVLK